MPDTNPELLEVIADATARVGGQSAARIMQDERAVAHATQVFLFCITEFDQ